MKTLKKAGGRILTVFVVIFGELFLIAAIVGLAELYSRWLYTILVILLITTHVYCLFRLALRDEDMESKLPWFLILIFLPYIGPLVYLTFSTWPIKKNEQKILREAEEKSLPYLAYDEQQIYIDTFMYARYFNYLRKLTYQTATKGNHISYFKNGEEFFPELYKRLEEAKEFIFFEFFIIDKGEVWDTIHEILVRKANEGVEVRLLMDDVGCAGCLPEHYYKTLRKEGINAYKFNTFSPILSGIYNNRDHRKIVVIDHKYAFTGGANIADEYANKITRFGYWKDTMIELQGPGINNFIATFLSCFDLASKQSSDYEHYLDYEYEKYEDEGYALMFGDNGGPYDFEQVGTRNYINMIRGAKKELYISTPYLIPPARIIDELCGAANRGVEVHLIIPGIPDKKIVYVVGQLVVEKLLESGVHVYQYTPGFNHMKSCVADDEIAFVGSINLDYRSLLHHFECGVLMYNVPCIKEITADFKEMINVSKEYPNQFKLKGFKRFIAKILKIFTPLL